VQIADAVENVEGSSEPGVVADSPHEVLTVDAVEDVEGSSECRRARSVMRTVVKDRAYRLKRRRLLALRRQMFSFESPPKVTVFKRLILPAETSE